MAGLATNARAQSTYQVYEYDSFGNLIRSWSGGGRDAGFAYDPADNRTAASVVQGAAPPQPPEPPQPTAAAAYNVLRSQGRTVVVPRSP
jgi:YD repeat-containing protein